MGTYTNTDGNGQCSACAAGTYANFLATSICTNCAAGLQGPAGMSTDCKTAYDLFTEVSTANGKARHIINADPVAVSSLASKAHASSISPDGGFMLSYAWTESAIYKYTYAMG
ncbi:MAG: hypothetical protein WCN27_05670, partial [Alphaproteobacteria bacterium]